MEYSYAETICVLKINTQCESCKVKVMQVLEKIRGVYSVTIDGEEGTMKFSGRVNPNTLLRVHEKYGKHAEVKYIKFEGEVVERKPNHYGEYGYNNPYVGMQYCSYPPPLPFHQHYPHYSQPPPPPPPRGPVLYQFPPPSPPGPFRNPPPPPPVNGDGPPPSSSVCPPKQNPIEDTSSRQNKLNNCAMM